MYLRRPLVGAMNLMVLGATLIGLLIGCRDDADEPRSFTMLHSAVCDGDIAEVERWINDEASDIHVRDKHGKTPLCLAARKGRKDIAMILLDHGANVSDGSLAYAVAGRRRDMVRFLLSKGARPGGDPLVQAAGDGNAVMAGLLIEAGADVDVKGVDVVHGEPGVKPYGLYGDTPLCRAAVYGKLDIVKLLVENNADVNLRGLNGYPVDMAKEMGHKAIVELLLSHGAREEVNNDAGKAERKRGN